MRLLLISDLHENTRFARRAAERAREFDVLVCAGDLANARRGVERCVGELRASQAPVVLVPGNNESAEELRAACEGWAGGHVLHGGSVVVQGQTFFGLGGGIPVTPFGAWSWDFTEKQAVALLAPCPRGCVLVSHSPPQGVVDRSSAGAHLGSVAVREAATRCAARLVVCGHVHASGGQHAMLGTTPVVNAGPSGVEWTL